MFLHKQPQLLPAPAHDLRLAGLSRKGRREFLRRQAGFANVQPTQFAGSLSSNTNRSHSPSVFRGIDLHGIRLGTVPGFYVDDDFVDFGLPGTQTTEINLGRYKVYNTGAAKVQSANGFPTTHVAGGVISILCDTAGDQGVIGTHASPFLLNSSAGKLGFEARFAMTGIATNNAQVYLGLSETVAMTFGAAVPLADADALGTTGGNIGFNILEDGLGVLNASYADRAAAWTNVEASVGTMAAHTWKKLGMRYDPADTLRAVRFYVDGVECANAISAATLAALTYLDVNGLGLCFAMFADSAGTSTYGYLDWWKCYQQMPN